MSERSELSAALDFGLKLLNIKASDISRKSGVSEGQLSRFRSGQTDMGVNDFAKIVRVLPPQMQQVIVDCILLGNYSEAEIVSRILKAKDTSSTS